MDTIQKLKALGSSVDYELDGVPRWDTAGFDDPGSPVCGSNGKDNQGFTSNCSTEQLPVFMASAGGKRIPILKTVLTSVCERDCHYCAMRSGSDCRRFSFKPEELANTFLSMYRSKVVQGIFLSSGIAGGGVHTQDQLLATADILRNKLGFLGYLHLKIMPGSEKAQVERAMQLADRVSVNLETTSTALLQKLAPHKLFLDELLQPLKWVNEIRQNCSTRAFWQGHSPSSTTQFVVGPAGETDFDLLHLSGYLFQELKLSRVYYSRFNPIPGTPLENEPFTLPKRQARLYQASFLLRDYGFDVEDFKFVQSGNMPYDKDPKTLWAEENLQDNPIEVNKAEYTQLLKVPGIGPKGARRIIEWRRRNSLRCVEELRQMGIRLEAAKPYLLVNGRKMPQQLQLFDQPF